METIDYPLTFASQSARFTEALSTVNWCLYPDRIERSTHYFPEIFFHGLVTDFRLCFYPGSRGPSRFACYFKYRGEWNRKQVVLSLTEQADPKQYSAYYHFVSTWIQDVRTINPATKIQLGLSRSMTVFYFVLLLIVAATPGFFVKHQMIDNDDAPWLYFITCLLCWPLGSSLYYYFPSVLPHLAAIPYKVLPPPESKPM